ncbi:MAG: hypothetical protein H6668_21040 [Ardenticatenaceae bacterium]|nr:hypothetical protein [Ardenticatenaceae bacterium]
MADDDVEVRDGETAVSVLNSPTATFAASLGGVRISLHQILATMAFLDIPRTTRPNEHQRRHDLRSVGHSKPLRPHRHF